MLDTSAVVLLMRHRRIANPEAVVPFATFGELAVGIFRSNGAFDEIERVVSTIAPAIILFSTANTSIWYGRITAELQRIGLPIPANDVWNAALALEHDLPLLSDDDHFRRVTGLRFIPAH